MDFQNPNPLARLRIITCALARPRDFQYWVQAFEETLSPYYENEAVMNKTAEMIVDQALVHPNFQTGIIELCHVIKEQCPKFRLILRRYCDKQLSHIEYGAAAGTSLPLFLSKICSGPNDDSMNLYIQFLHWLLKTDKNNVEMVCQILETTGSTLEAHNKEAIDGLFKKMLYLKPLHERPIVDLINSVIALRATDWGNNPDAPVPTCSRYLFKEPTANDNLDGNVWMIEQQYADCRIEDSDPLEAAYQRHLLLVKKRRTDWHFDYYF